MSNRDALQVVVAEKLADARLQAALSNALGIVRPRMEAAIARLADPAAARQAAGDIRKENVRHLQEHLEALEGRLTEAGTHVLWAQDAAEARRHVAEIVRRHKALRTVASKTMVGEEIGLEQAVRAGGSVLVQSDLGERVVQLAGQRPSHITAPCLHLDAAQVGRILEAGAGMPRTGDPEEMCRFLARALRPVFFDAQIAVSGANLAIADTGEIVIVENEGNARMGFTLAPVHVVLMGLERVVASRQEAAVMLSLLPRGATGQDATVYTSFLQPGPFEGRTRYVILVDNGRTRVFNAGPHRELLRCIRCGACMNVCPVYERVGGHAYLWTYPGPIGIALAPFMASPDVAARVPDLCTLCAACTEVCPVRIPLDRLIALGRSLANDSKPAAEQRRERRLARWFARAMSGRAAYAATCAGHRLLARLGKHLDRLEERLGWGQERAAPRPARKLFRRMFRGVRRGGEC